MDIFIARGVEGGFVRGGFTVQGPLQHGKRARSGNMRSCVLSLNAGNPNEPRESDGAERALSAGFRGLPPNPYTRV